MSGDLNVGVKITADSRGLVSESRAAREALSSIGQTAKSSNAQSSSAAASFTANLKRQSDTLGLTASQTRAYDAAQLNLNAAQRSSVESSNRAIDAFERKQRTTDKLRIGVIALATAIGVGLVSAYRSSISLTTAAEQSSLRLEAVLRGTAYAAGLTKVELDALALRTRGRLGIDDDVLRDSMAVLLTFRNVAKQSFGDALEIAADLSAVLQTDLRSATLQLGKALENPEQGLTALTRSGVSFNDTQKETIKGMVEMGRQGEAITLILKTMREQGLDKVAESMNQGLIKPSRDAGFAWEDLLKTLGNTSAVSGGIEGFFGSLTGYLINMRKVIESGDWLDRLAFFTVGFTTPSILALPDFPEIKDPDRGAAKAGLERQKAAEQKALALRGEKKAEEEAAKAAEDAAKRMEAAAKSRAAASARAAKQAVDGSKRIIESLKRETEQIGLNVVQKRLLNAITAASKAPTQELAREILSTAEAWAKATEEEKRNLDLPRVPIPGRKPEVPQLDEQKRLFRGIDQFAIQSARNIQTQFARGLANGFKDGLGSFKDFMRDILAEISSAQILSGIENLFVGAGGALKASDPAFRNDETAKIKSFFNDIFAIKGSTASSAKSTKNTLGIFDSASQGKFGVAASGVLNKLGNNFNPVGGAIAVTGAQLTGASDTTTALAGVAATFGGPIGIAVAAGLIATDFLDKKFGDFKLPQAAKDFKTAIDVQRALITGGLSVVGDKLFDKIGIPDPGTLILKALFGRGPFKLRQTNLIGQITAEGISGFTSTKVTSKGSLFRKKRTDRILSDVDTGQRLNFIRQSSLPFADSAGKGSEILGDFFDNAIKGMSQSLRGVAVDLGLGTSAIDNFSTSINIASKKGKFFTDEEINKAIESIANQMATKLVPSLNDLDIAGESAFETVARLGSEFKLLQKADQLLGESATQAKQNILELSFADRSQLITSFGGAQASRDILGFFADNFVDEKRKLEIASDDINGVLNKMGLSAQTLSREGFGNLLEQSLRLGEAGAQTAIDLRGVGDEFLRIKNASTSLAGTAFNDLQKAVDRERRDLTTRFNDDLDSVNTNIQNVGDSVGRLKTLSDSLKSTLSTLRPLDRAQAKSQIQSAIDTVRAGGDLPDADSLRDALTTLGRQSTSGFASAFEFEREQRKTANLVADLGNLTGEQLTLQERSLSALEAQRDRLQDGFKADISRLDGILTNAKSQLDTLSGIDSTLKTIAQALVGFNAALPSGRADIFAGLSSGPFVGPSQASNQNITDFFAVTRTPYEIARAAADNNVSSKRIAQVLGLSSSDVNQFFDDNPSIKRFADGGRHFGGARIVGERGPEFEVTGPSQITSNNDLRKMMSNDDVVAKIDDLVEVLKKNNEFNQRVANKLDSVTAVVNGRLALRTGT